MGSLSLWLLRHAIVALPARNLLYGTLDVQICEAARQQEAPLYAALARRLPRPARWLVTPLSRTRATAEAIFAAGYPATELAEEPELVEQSFGAWQGLAYADLPKRLTAPAHPFWPVAASERPPGGESMEEVIRRVGGVLERLAARPPAEAVVAVAHGGVIRAAVAHALGLSAHAALSFSVHHLSLSRLDRVGRAWRVGSVNEDPLPDCPLRHGTAPIGAMASARMTESMDSATGVGER